MPRIINETILAKKDMDNSTSKKRGMVNNAYLMLILATSACADLDNRPNVTINDKLALLDGNAFVAKGIVHFPDVNFYQGFIETRSEAKEKSLLKDLDESADYVSLKKVSGLKLKISKQGRTLGIKEIELAETNDFISTLINADGMISIGDYYFKINLNTEKAYVLRKEHLAQITDLENENIENKNIMIFNTSDDVLDLLEIGVKGTTTGRTQLCFESGAAAKDDKEIRDYPNCSINIRTDNKVVYQKVAIYFSLQAKTKIYGFLGNWGPITSSGQTITYYFKFEPKCQGVTEESGIRTDGWPDNEMSYRPYERSYGLHKYIYQAKFATGDVGCSVSSRQFEIRDGF
jgi:hypothetical protein